jgi:hypothetical protein
MVSPETEAGPTLFKSPTAPGWAPVNTDGTAAQICAARHIWDEAVHNYLTYTSVQQALKKHIINVLNNKIVGFANITAREMLDHLFISYGSTMAVDLENNFEQMCRA